MLVKVICISSSCEPGRMKRFFRKKQTFEMENKNKAFQSSSICVCIYLVICLPTYFIFVVPEVCIPNAELFFRLPAKGGDIFLPPSTTFRFQHFLCSASKRRSTA